MILKDRLLLCPLGAYNSMDDKIIFKIIHSACYCLNHPLLITLIGLNGICFSCLRRVREIDITAVCAPQKTGKGIPLRFNPTMVRLGLAVLEAAAMKVPCFNPTMVRLGP